MYKLANINMFFKFSWLQNSLISELYMDIIFVSFQPKHTLTFIPLKATTGTSEMRSRMVSAGHIQHMSILDFLMFQ